MSKLESNNVAKFKMRLFFHFPSRKTTSSSGINNEREKIFKKVKIIYTKIRQRGRLRLRFSPYVNSFVLVALSYLINKMKNNRTWFSLLPVHISEISLLSYSSRIFNIHAVIIIHKIGTYFLRLEKLIFVSMGKLFLDTKKLYFYNTYCIIYVYLQ